MKINRLAGRDRASRLLASLAGALLVAGAVQAGPVVFVTPDRLAPGPLTYRTTGPGTTVSAWYHSYCFRPVPLVDNSTQLAYEQSIALQYLRARFPAPQWQFGAAASGFTGTIQLADRMRPDAPNTDPLIGYDGPGQGVDTVIDVPQPTGPYVTREYIVIQRRFNNTEANPGSPWLSPPLVSGKVLGSPFAPRGQRVYSQPQRLSLDGFDTRPQTAEFRGVLGGQIDACVTTSFVALHYFDQYGNHSVTLYNGFIHQNSFKPSSGQMGPNFPTPSRAYPWVPATPEPTPR